MHLLANGMVTTGMTESPGRLLLSGRSIFVLKETVNAAPAAAIFGLLGALVAGLAGRAGAPKEGPGYLADPDLAGMPERDRRALRGTRLLVKYTISPSLKVTPTKMGFSFDDGSTGTKFSGLLHKKKIAAYLQAQGLAP
ncbi:MAG: hypothetical protein ABW032_00390 [Burkholderiaceae bacterium]